MFWALAQVEISAEGSPARPLKMVAWCTDTKSNLTCRCLLRFETTLLGEIIKEGFVASIAFGSVALDIVHHF